MQAQDYTGADVTVANFLAVLKGDAAAVKGGSGKVIASGPKDHVFVYYSDHGGPGILGMPEPPFLMGDDINRVLREKHAARGFEELVFYLEACESGSIFQGLLPKDINVYAVTAANAEENSWGELAAALTRPGTCALLSHCFLAWNHLHYPTEKAGRASIQGSALEGPATWP